jgi:2-keto-4-pentenoate hydratase/2-oxohepta-3-ene-1,7-dioic acid hydratase in catechol pathway
VLHPQPPEGHPRASCQPPSPKSTLPTEANTALTLATRLLSEAPAATRLPQSAVRLAAPLLPSTLIFAGSNYRAHIKEKQNTPLSGREPEFFLKTADCVVGPNEPIVHDARLTRKLDCETELAVVIGKVGRHIPVERALDHVFGYTIINDVTARDRQVRTTAEGFTWYELGRGKAFDSSAPLGPCITTADEIPDPQALLLSTRINGELRLCSSTAEMIWDCAALIHFFSINFTLKPGMVISTGTPAGTAWSTDSSLGGKWQDVPGLVPATRYCLPGDVVESEIEKIGVLRNPVVAASED